MAFRKLKPILCFCSADELSDNRLILDENSCCNYGDENNCSIVMYARTQPIVSSSYKNIREVGSKL